MTKVSNNEVCKSNPDEKKLKLQAALNTCFSMFVPKYQDAAPQQASARRPIRSSEQAIK